MRKTITLLIALSALAASLYAEEPIVQQGDFQMQGTVLVKYTGPGGDVAIPNGITAIGESAFHGHYRITSVSIPASVVSIGDYAFVSCGRLRSITVDIRNPSFTSEAGILFTGDKTRVFKYPDAMEAETYTIPAGVTSIGDYAFSGCDWLTAITIPEGVITIGDGAFAWCEGLTTITIPSGVKRIGHAAFDQCINLISISIPASVTSIGESVFFECVSIKELYLARNSPLDRNIFPRVMEIIEVE